MPGLLRVEVAYARPERQVLIPLEVPPGTTLIEAVRQSGILREFPELELAGATLGVFGKVKAGTEILGDGDRVEIYRPLLADPKEARRRRAHN
ncbi:MAG: RnfH family protein [Nevskiales bacterium]